MMPHVNPTEMNLPAAVQATIDDAVTRLGKNPAVKLRLGQRAKRSKVATEAQSRGNTPFHAVEVPILDEKAVRALMNPASRARFDQLLKELRSRPTPCSADQVHSRHRLLAVREHVEALTRTLGPKITAEEAALSHAVEYFEVSEEKAVTGVDPRVRLSVNDCMKDGLIKRIEDRLRPILWPEEKLRTSEYVPDMSLHTAFLVRHLIADNEFGAQFDIKCSYWHTATHGAFVLRTEDGEFIRIDRMPFGLDSAAEI